MTLEQLLDRLRQVRSLSFVARSNRTTTGWNGKGVGTVEVREAGGSMTWHEQGSWRPEGRDRDIRFSNVYRWTLVGELLRLEHLRFGEANPVLLFDMAQAGEWEWRDTAPHLCREDCYSAILLVRDDGIALRWSIDGPGKSDTIEYDYR